MNIRGARDLSVPIVLALLGAALCVGSLFLHWVELDLSVMEQWMQTSPLLESARAQSAMTPEQLHVGLQAGMDAAMKEFGSELTGLKALKFSSVIAQVASAGYVVAAIARFMNQGTARGRLAIELALPGAFLLFRPFWARTHLPNDDASAFFGGDILLPGKGITVAMIGAVLILVSAVLAWRSAASGLDADEAFEQEQAQMAARTGGGGYVPTAQPAGAFVPPNLAPRPATTAAFVPTAPHIPGQPPAPAPAAAPYAPPVSHLPGITPPPAHAAPPMPAAQPYAPPPAHPAPAAPMPQHQPRPGGQSVAPPGFS